MPISQIRYKGKKIITVSYEDLQDSKEALIESADQLAEYVLSQPEKYIRVLLDVTSLYGSSEFMSAAKNARIRVLEEKQTISAALGVKGLKKILLQGYNAISKSKSVMPFDSKQEALDYLISEG